MGNKNNKELFQIEDIVFSRKWLESAFAPHSNVRYLIQSFEETKDGKEYLFTVCGFNKRVLGIKDLRLPTDVDFTVLSGYWKKSGIALYSTGLENYTYFFYPMS